MEQGLEEGHVNAVTAAKQEKAYILSVVIKGRLSVHVLECHTVNNKNHCQYVKVQIQKHNYIHSEYICTNTAHLYLNIEAI